MNDILSNDLTEEQMGKLVDAVAKGLPIADAVSMPSEVLEGLYSLAYGLYCAGNYQDAETMFKALCVYKYNDYRFLMGLAGSRQGLKQYELAIETYGMAGVISGLSNPEPLWFAANCYVKLNDKENTLNVLMGLVAICKGDNPEHVTYKVKAEALRNLLQADAVGHA